VVRAGARIAVTCAVLTGCAEEPRTYSTRAANGQIIVSDDFERAELGDGWAPSGEGARIENGVLKLRDLKNHPLWLATPLPDDVRIEFDTWATTEEGDIKVEIGGDGVSFARAVNYVATGYVVIFGGWNNTQNAIVRRNEHGRQKVVASEPKVEPGKAYHFTITRIGAEIRWDVDGREVLTYEDEHPLLGEGHQHFAFSGWEAETHFDNLVIEAI
jgi:hypothetical protein